MQRITHAIAAVTLACGLATTAQASPNVATDSAVFVERHNADASRRLEPAASLSRGDRVVTILRWYRLGGDGGFTITNPLPRAITYQQSSFANEQVSVDGGRTWGRLDDLKVGARDATPEDVTHVRWRISPGHSAKGKGQIAYRGIVR
ncbi:MAG: hypothetical protein R3D89_10225 [Sphingomonadaceae bacterium]